MYTVYKSIKEAFNSEVEVTKLDSSDKLNPPMPGLTAFKFKTTSDEVYLILHVRNPMMLSNYFNGFYSETIGRDFILHSIDFVKVVDPTKPFSPSNIIQTISPNKDVFKILSTVIKHTVSYYSKVKTDILLVSSKDSETSRGSLYGKLASKFASEGSGQLVGLKKIKMMGDSYSQHVIFRNDFNQELIQNDSFDPFLEEFDIDKI